MRRRFIVGNWKMHKTISQAESLVTEILQIYQPQDSVELAIAPPFVSLPAVARLLASTSIKLAAQNTCASDEGAFTGEISPPMLRDVGCHYVIIGHSERRHIFGETDQDINKKVHAAFHHDLLPILCVGERLEERQSNKTQAVIQQQLQTGLDGIESKNFEKITIAYEPVWAIGAGGIPATSDYADTRQKDIIATANDVLGRRIPCLYGGSVNPGNCEELISCPHIDGLFIGRSAWNVGGYLDILSKCAAKL